MNQLVDMRTRKSLGVLIRENRKMLYWAWVTLVLGVIGITYNLPIPVFVAGVVVYFGTPDFVIRLLTMLAQWRGREQNVCGNLSTDIEGPLFMYYMGRFLLSPLVVLGTRHFVSAAAVNPQLYNYTLMIIGLAVLPVVACFVVNKMRSLRASSH